MPMHFRVNHRCCELSHNAVGLPYILAYKSLSRISPPKNRVRIWSKVIDPRISRRWLLRPCTGCKLTVAYYSDVCTGPPSTAPLRWVTDVKATCCTVGRRSVASTWPL